MSLKRLVIKDWIDWWDQLVSIKRLIGIKRLVSPQKDWLVSRDWVSWWVSRLEYSKSNISVLRVTIGGIMTTGLRIFAGICNWRNIEESGKTITCAKMEGGEICYGIFKKKLEEKKKKKNN